MNNGSTNNNTCDITSSVSQHDCLLPDPIITKRTRTTSTSNRALEYPESTGIVKVFCREKGHGFITPKDGSDDIFVHVSDIDGEFVPIAGDEVKYRLCPIPPKLESFQAVHVNIINFVPEIHLKWNKSK